MTQLALRAVLACAFLLSGCGASSDREPPPVNETAFGDMVGTMDKARGVQDTVDAHKQDTDQQLQTQEGQSEQ